MLDFDALINAILSNVIVRLCQHISGRLNRRILPILSHYTIGTIRRRRQRWPFCFYECSGGIITSFHDPKSAHIDMEDVPHWLFKIVERIAKVQSELGRIPSFDFNGKGPKYIYRICTETDVFRSHTLVFYRRPRLFI